MAYISSQMGPLLQVMTGVKRTPFSWQGSSGQGLELTESSSLGLIPEALSTQSSEAGLRESPGFLSLQAARQAGRPAGDL